LIRGFWVTVIALSIAIAFLCPGALAQEIGNIEIKPPLGKAAIPLENLKDMLELLKSLESEIQKISNAIEVLRNDIQKNLREIKDFSKSSSNEIADLIKNLKIPDLDLKPLEEEIKLLQNMLDRFQSEALKKMEDEVKFLKEEVSSKLDFLTTVMKRAMVVFKNMEDLSQEAQALKEEIKTAGEEAKKISELSQKTFVELKSSQSRVTGLLMVNLILLALLTFLEIEKRFRKSPTQRSDKTEGGENRS